MSIVPNINPETQTLFPRTERPFPCPVRFCHTNEPSDDSLTKAPGPPAEPPPKSILPPLKVHKKSTESSSPATFRMFAEPLAIPNRFAKRQVCPSGLYLATKPSWEPIWLVLPSPKLTVPLTLPDTSMFPEPSTPTLRAESDNIPPILLSHTREPSVVYLANRQSVLTLSEVTDFTPSPTVPAKKPHATTPPEGCDTTPSPAAESFPVRPPMWRCQTTDPGAGPLLPTIRINPVMLAGN